MYKKILEQLIAKRLEKYIKYKFTIKPRHKISALTPLLLSPILGVIIINFFTFIFMAYMVINNELFFSYTGEQKGYGVAEVAALLFGLLTIFSYLYTLIVINTISILMKHKNTNLFIYINIIVSFFIALFIGTYLYETNKNNLSYIYMPLTIFINGIFNTFSYKLTNELFYRDEDGKIVYE